MANKNFIVKNGLDVGGLITGTTTTQSASDNTTKLASTAYVTTALANLADSAPSTLNTLNELAAALGDDENFSTTVTDSIAAKLPLAGGTITGDLRLNTTLGIGVNASSAIGVYLTKSLANGLAAELSNTESSTGSGLVVKGGNNSSTYSADFRDYNNNSLMRIRGDGNVGIGTNSPLGLLSIKGTGDAIRVESTNTGAGGAQIDLLHYTTSPADNDIHGAINFGGYYSGSSSAYGSAIRSVWSDVSAKEAQLEFFTRDDSDFAVRMIVDKDGNVGIGGAPDSSGRLLVTNGGTNQIVLKGASGTTNLNMGNFVGGGYISNNYYYSSGHQADDNSKGAFEVFIGDENYGINYHAAGAAGTRRRDFAIDNTGKVGIGTNSPSTKLEVAGDVKLGAVNPMQTSTNVVHGTSGENGFLVRTAVSGATAPTYSNIDDTNTGMFFASADTLGFTTGGSEKLRITSQGQITQTGATNTSIGFTIKATATNDYVSVLQFNDNSGVRSSVMSDHYNNALIFKHNSNVERMRIDSAGTMILRADGAANFGRLQFSSQANTYQLLGGNYIGYMGYKTGGYHRFFGSDGAEDWRINSSGHFTPGQQHAMDIGGVNAEVRNIYAQGLYVGGSAAANKLDDYEEGTWTPDLRNSTTSLSTQTWQYGPTANYTKIGDLVFIHLSGKLSGVGGTGGSELRIFGLPFSGKATGGYQEYRMNFFLGDQPTAADSYQGFAFVRNNGTDFGTRLLQGGDNLFTSNRLDNDTFFTIFGCYKTNQ